MQTLDWDKINPILKVNGVLKITGPTVSGKTSMLAKIAQGSAQALSISPARIQTLAVSSQNQRALKRLNAGVVMPIEDWFLQLLNALEKTAAPSCEIKPWRLLGDIEATLLLQTLIPQTFEKIAAAQQREQASYPLAFASRHTAMASAFWHYFSGWLATDIPEAELSRLLSGLQHSETSPAPFSLTEDEQATVELLVETFLSFRTHLQDARLLTYAQVPSVILALLNKTPEALPKLSTEPQTTLSPDEEWLPDGNWVALQNLGKPELERPFKFPALLCIDEAQELSNAQHTVLAKLGIPLVLAGNAALSIRMRRGTSPDAFHTLDAYSERISETLTLTAKQSQGLIATLSNYILAHYTEDGKSDSSETHSSVEDTDLENIIPDCNIFPDIAAEAQGVAEVLLTYQTAEEKAGRSANWNDCAILMRSARFKNEVSTALIDAGIPFRTQEAPESIITYQHHLYDALQIIQGLNEMAISPSSLLDARAMRQAWKSTTAQETLNPDTQQRFNRHLRRWLEERVSIAQRQNGIASVATEACLSTFQLTDTPSEPCLWAEVLLSDSALLSKSMQILKSAFTALQSGHWQEFWMLLRTECGTKTLSEVNVEVGAPDNKAEANDYADAFDKRIEALHQLYIETLKQPLPLAHLLTQYPAIWDRVLETGLPKRTGNTLKRTPQVRLLSMQQAQGEHIPCVIIPFLSEREIPQHRQETELIPMEVHNKLALPAWPQNNQATEARLFVSSLQRATHTLFLSTYEKDAGNTVGSIVQPSPFFKLIQTELNQLSVSKSDSVPKVTSVPEKTLQAIQASTEDFMGSSHWARLSKSEAEPVYSPQERLTLSASSIKTYMKCPRQFFYKHVLSLKGEGSLAMTTGNLTHKVMELFNIRFQEGKGDYNVETLKVQADALFLFDINPEQFEAAGYTERERRDLNELSPISQATFRERLDESIMDLERKGYFHRYASPQQVIAEMKLNQMQLPELPDCQFSGAVDALIQRQDGLWDILDYKTFRSAYSAKKLTTCDDKFQTSVDALPIESDLSHEARFKEKLDPKFPTDYQLPLYFYACDQLPTYAGQLNGVNLQIIRPQFPDSPEQGAIRVDLAAETLQTNRTQVLADIRDYIVMPIQNAQDFPINPSAQQCAQCNYLNICNTETPDEQDADFAAETST